MARSRRNFDETEALDAAVDVFWEHGYQGASLDMLLDAMEIGRQSLYAWMGDKRRLFMAALRRYEETATPELMRRMLEDGADGSESVLELMRWIGRSARSQSQRGCLLTTSVAEFAHGDEEIRRVVDGQLDLFRRAVLKALRKSKRDGQLPDGVQVAATANMLLLMRNGMMLAGRAGTPDSGIDAAIELVERHLAET